MYFNIDLKSSKHDTHLNSKHQILKCIITKLKAAVKIFQILIKYEMWGTFSAKHNSQCGDKSAMLNLDCREMDSYPLCDTGRIIRIPA